MKQFGLMLFAFLYCASHSGFAQDYDDLLNLYLNEKYEKMLDKALDYTESTEHKSNAVPYVYCSMAYYHLSHDEKYKSDYPNAFENTIKYAIEFKKNDTSHEYFDQYLDYIFTLRDAVIESARTAVTDGRHAEAKSIMEKTFSLFEDDEEYQRVYEEIKSK